MDKNYFFKVWDIYQNYWGKEEQHQLKKITSANLLNKIFKKSRKLRALSTMRNLLSVLWEMDMFIHENELLDTVRDMSEAFMGEEYTDDEKDPYTRMQHCIHTYKQTCYLTVEEREWKNIQKPSVFMTDPDIYNVSAILVLP